MATSTYPTPTCDGIIGSSLAERDGWPVAGRRYCLRTVGVATWTDRDGARWTACILHLRQVIVLHPIGPLCGCSAALHGRTGCLQPATVHSEDAELLMPCLDCGPYETVGLHGHQMHGGYSRAELAQAAVDGVLR